MKKYFTLFIIAAAGLMGCNKSNTVPFAQSIKVTATVGSMTKVAYDGNKSAFEAGDSLSLFAWTGDKTVISKDLVVDNVTNTLGKDDLWQPKTQMLWDDMTTLHYFMAVSPAREVASFTADPYILNSSAAKYQESDLLIAINDEGLTAQNNPVELNFSHAMAKLNVNLAFRNQWTEGNPPSQTDITEAKIDTLIATARKSATINYIKKAVTATGAAGSVGMNRVANASWTTLMVPQDGFRTVTIHLAGNDEWLGGNGTYEFNATEDIPLLSGKVTTVNLIIGRDQITLDASEGGITITDWTDAATVNGKIVNPTEEN